MSGCWSWTTVALVNRSCSVNDGIGPGSPRLNGIVYGFVYSSSAVLAPSVIHRFARAPAAFASALASGLLGGLDVGVSAERELDRALECEGLLRRLVGVCRTSQRENNR